MGRAKSLSGQFLTLPVESHCGSRSAGVAISPTLCRFPRLLFPVFGLLGLAGFLSLAVAHAAVDSDPVLATLKRMASLAVCFENVNGRGANALKDVRSLRDQLQVGRIAARRVSADVMHLGVTSRLNSARHWTNMQGVHDPMDSFGLSTKETQSVPCGILWPRPIPAFIANPNLNVGEQSTVLFGVQRIDS